MKTKRRITVNNAVSKNTNGENNRENNGINNASK